jgi:hypothetical protein
MFTVRIGRCGLAASLFFEGLTRAEISAACDSSLASEPVAQFQLLPLIIGWPHREELKPFRCGLLL